MRFTIKDLMAMKDSGKIKGYIVIGGRGHSKQGMLPGRVVAKAWKNAVHPQKTWVCEFLLGWCGHRYVRLWEEFRFHPTRKWRFDWAIPDLMIAIEYEGLAFKKTGHTESKGYSDNTDKYNEAAAMGWTVFRITYLNYGTIEKRLNDFEKLKNQSNVTKTLPPDR